MLKMATSSGKLENCEVCATKKAKYTCPKCEVRTCCLTCVNIHKKELECDGIRDKTKFVPLKSFTDLDVLNDYRLLEDVGRSVDQLKKDPTKRYTRQSILPVHLMKLKAAAYKRKVYLQFMPQNFSRHKDNSTFLKWKTNELYWRIEWIFPEAEHIKWVTERALESIRLSVLLEQVLDPINSLEDRNNIEEFNLKRNLNEKLQFYQAAGTGGIRVLLKAERVEKSGSKFYDLDITQTLRENFENKTIIEFPTLYVILKDRSDMYEIIETDDEDDTKMQTDNGNPGRSRKRTHEQIGTKDNASVNYFFNYDCSDSDEERSSNSGDKGKLPTSFDIPDYNELIKMEH